MFKDFAKVFGVMWVVSALCSLAVAGGVIYVVIHFASKFW